MIAFGELGPVVSRHIVLAPAKDPRTPTGIKCVSLAASSLIFDAMMEKIGVNSRDKSYTSHQYPRSQVFDIFSLETASV